MVLDDSGVARYPIAKSRLRRSRRRSDEQFKQVLLGSGIGDEDGRYGVELTRRIGVVVAGFERLMNPIVRTVQVRRAAQIRQFASFDALLAQRSAGTLHAVLFPLADQNVEQLCEQITALHSLHPHVRLIAALHLASRQVRLLVPLARMGVSDVIFAGLDPEPEVVARILASDEPLRADVGGLGAAMALLDPIASASTRALLRYCLGRSNDPRSVQDVAAHFGVSRRTLHNWLARDRLPPPATILSWTRLIRAAMLGQRSVRTLESVALQIGFSSGASLRRALWRHARLRTDVLWRHSAVHDLVKGLLDHWMGSRNDELGGAA